MKLVWHKLTMVDLNHMDLVSLACQCLYLDMSTLRLNQQRCHRYDPGTDIVDDISTEQERITFLQGIARIMLTKARLKLNIKRLYAADGHAVKELLKIALLLRKATDNANDVVNKEPQTG